MADTLVLVTGANGRTGRPIVAALTKRGIKVRAFIRKSEQDADLKAMGAVDCAIGDMEDPSSIDTAIKGLRKNCAYRSAYAPKRS